MKQEKRTKPIFRLTLLILCAALFTLLGLRLLTEFDNKYKAKAPITQDGVTFLPEQGVSYLVDGWELYPDRLLTPEDFSGAEQPSPCYSTWAGEYSSLAPFHQDGNLYGAATYRLHLSGTGKFALYLPEPLCAARVFVGRKDLGGPGVVEPDRYQPQIRDTVFSFSVEQETDLIIQTANYSHYYGGLWFPPAIGTPDEIHRLTSSRMIVYGLLCFSALALGLFCMVLWFDRRPGRDEAIFSFGLLCLSFALRVCYPFLRMWGVSSVKLLYAMEDVSALFGLYCGVRIALLLFLPARHRILRETAATLSLGMCLAGIMIPMAVLPAFPGFSLWYGPIVSWYQAIAGMFLTAMAVWGCIRGNAQAWTVLAALTVNGVCLLWGVLSIGQFEPVIGAWPSEYGGFVMVLSFATLMVRRNREMLEENIRLNEHLKEEVEEKTRHLTLLVKERSQLMAELGHDMKSPLTALSNMAQIIRQNDIMLDEQTNRQIQGIEDKCQVLADRLQSIQELAVEAETPARMETLSLNEFLSSFHRGNQPVIELTGPDFLCQLTHRPCLVWADREKLSRALENLVFNASEFTPPDGTITLSLEQEENDAVIRVADTGCGIPESELPNIFKRSYTTRKQEGGQGLGLAIARSIILEHGGEIHVDSAVGTGSTFSIRLPLAREADGHDGR